MFQRLLCEPVGNTPAFFGLLPSVAGLRTLDLGCGEGHNTRLLADRGAAVVALDISARFIRAAADRAVPGIDHVVGDGAELPFVSNSFDAVTAFMSLMDVAEPERAVAIGGYFYEGPVNETWTFGAAPAEIRSDVRPFEITYARRTLSGWLNAAIAAGLAITAIDESHADETTAEAHPGVADTRIAPYFLIVQARQRT